MFKEGWCRDSSTIVPTSLNVHSWFQSPAPVLFCSVLVKVVSGPSPVNRFDCSEDEGRSRLLARLWERLWSRELCVSPSTGTHAKRDLNGNFSSSCCPCCFAAAVVTCLLLLLCYHPVVWPKTKKKKLTLNVCMLNMGSHQEKRETSLCRWHCCRWQFSSSFLWWPFSSTTESWTPRLWGWSASCIILMLDSSTLSRLFLPWSQKQR